MWAAGVARALHESGRGRPPSRCRLVARGTRRRPEPGPAIPEVVAVRQRGDAWAKGAQSHREGHLNRIGVPLRAVPLLARARRSRRGSPSRPWSTSEVPLTVRPVVVARCRRRRYRSHRGMVASKHGQDLAFSLSEPPQFQVQRWCGATEDTGLEGPNAILDGGVLGDQLADGWDAGRWDHVEPHQQWHSRACQPRAVGGASN